MTRAMQWVPVPERALILTCHEALDVLRVADGIVVLKHVEVERHDVAATQVLPQLMVWAGPPPSQHIIIPAAHVDELGEWIVETPMVADDDLKVGVGIHVDLPIGCVQDLLDHQACSTEDSKRGPDVITGYVKLITAAQLHGKEVSLQVVIEGRDLRAGVVVEVGDLGGVGQVCIEELQVVAMGALAGHPPPKAIIAVPDTPATSPVVGLDEQAS